MLKKHRTRITIVSIVGLVLVAAAMFYVNFYLLRPSGSGPAGPEVAAEPFTETWTERPVQVIGLGDSVTAGFGADSMDHTYFERMLHNPPDEFADMQGKALDQVLPQLSAENLSVSGSISAEHLNTIETKLPTYDSEVYGIVVMTTGGNDLIHNYGRTPPREGAMYGATLAEAEPWIASFESRLSEMLEKIEAKFPGGCEIYLADIYDPTDGVGDAPSVFLPPWPDAMEILGRYNDVLRDAAQNRANVHHVPLHATFLGHGSHCRQFWRSTYVADDPYYWFYENIEDPNDRGYDAIRRIFLNAIVEQTKLRGEPTNQAAPS